MSIFLDPTSDALQDKPMRDTTNRFHYDAILRRKGFRIHSRPKKGPAIWLLGDTPYTYEEALKSIGVEP